MSRPMNGSCGRMGMAVVSRLAGRLHPSPGSMLLRAAIVGSAGFSHAFPTRDTADAELLAAVGGVPIAQIKQVHGARAVLATDAKGAEGDALVARAGGGPVGMRVADCVPVLVASVKTG